MSLDEIVLPETKPETEWVRGRALQKMSPRRDHSRVQMEFGNVLSTWSRGRGEVGPEWRFRLAPEGDVRRPLVPDLAYVANTRLRGVSHDDLQAPGFAPTVAVEIHSPGDRAKDFRSKRDIYLQCGTVLVIWIDPGERKLIAYEAGGAQTFTIGQIFSHPALPDFTVDLGAFFARALELATDDTASRQPDLE